MPLNLTIHECPHCGEEHVIPNVPVHGCAHYNLPCGTPAYGHCPTGDEGNPEICVLVGDNKFSFLQYPRFSLTNADEPADQATQDPHKPA